VQNTLEVGLSPGLNLIFGFPGDTEKDLQERKEFLLKYDPADELRTIRPVTAYPGCRLFDEAIDKGLVKNAEDFYERLHVNSDLVTVNFTDIPTPEMNKILYEANIELVKNYMNKRYNQMEETAKNFYINGDKSFRGWRPV
jgi:radical SAM superfamily enzyme YgiQ (UPF0313 family)